MRPVTTGFPSIDEALGGLITGDNVVWLCDDVELYSVLAGGLVGATLTSRSERWLHVDLGAGLLTDLSGAQRAGVDRLDATPGSPFRNAVALADELERRVQVSTPVCLVIDPLSRAGRGWSADTAQRFFERICPAMLQAGVTAYWSIDPALGRGFVDQVRQITQCLLDVRGARLRVLKAEGRPDGLLEIAYHLSVDGRSITATSAPAGGRLARGLVAVRHQLGLTQQELAAIAGVTPSAISQAEAGSRGLSLDTVVTIADRLGMPLDRLVGGLAQRGYRLARHDRARRLPDSDAASGVIALATDSTVGLRSYLVELTGPDWKAPPFEHRGVASITVHRGLVQVDLDDDKPVLRAGDALVVDGAPVKRWRRLRREPASCFWVVRD